MAFAFQNRSRRKKLTEAMVVDIKTELKRTEPTKEAMTKIAERYGVSFQHIYRIKSGTAWTFVRARTEDK